MSRAAAPLPMSGTQRSTLEQVARSQTAPHRDVVRARALLAAADGVANIRIAADLNVTPVSVRAWRARFDTEGLATWGQVRAGRGRRPSIPEDTVARIVDLTVRSPRRGRTRWSARDIARRVGVSPASVQRIWAARGLKPHQGATQVAGSRHEARLIDVVGFFRDPPGRAVVLCTDSDCPLRAVDRRRRASSPGIGRNPYAPLLTALDGPAARQSLPQHRHGEFLDFLREINRSVPGRLQVHVIADNGYLHQHPATAAWLRAHQRFHVHSTPTSSTWLALVEAWIRELTDAARPTAFPSHPDLLAALGDHRRGDEPQPVAWTATAAALQANVKRGRSRPAVVSHS